MQVNYTKGPWRFHENGDGSYTILTEDNKWVIAFIQNGEKWNEEQIATAKLIAAAPDLLEALQIIVEYWNTPQEGSMNDHIDHSLKLATAAIKKATA